jgi:hypothetical protein
MPTRYFRTATFAALLLMTSLPLVAQPDITAAGLQQINDILTAKINLTPAQQKMDSNLAFGILAATNDPSVASFQNALAPLGATDVNGNTVLIPPAGVGLATSVTIEISANVNADLLNAITLANGSVLQQSPQWGLITATLPLGSLGAIAARADVQSLHTLSASQTNGPASIRLPRPRPKVTRSAILSRLGVGFVGSVTTQGYISHGANQVVSGLGFVGQGVTVGVLSDSASAARIAALIISGDLPPNTQVLPGQAGPANGTDEGTAMMEIVHDMAPGANLIFATAFNGAASFANNILALANAGCKVIVDDVTYFNEGVFQDGPIAQAVNQVTANGVTYFSSAANSGSLTLGTSGTWEGDFLNGGPVTGPIATLGETGSFHNFGGAGSPQNYDALTATSSFISLKWSDPLHGSANDYDLFILNSTGTIVKGFSAGSQTGTQDPYEFVSQGTNCGTAQARGYCPAVGDRIVVVLFAGAPRALHVDTERGQLSLNTAGATFGHNAGASTVSIAATYWNSARTGTRPFTGFANRDEVFSSDGPRKIFYLPNGTPITAGNFLFGTNGGTTLLKPDFAAADGVSARTPGFTPFFGTSAAAPHAAGIAALILSARPGYTPDQVKAAMTATALDSMEVGPDRDSGNGIVMALPAVQYALSH